MLEPVLALQDLLIQYPVNGEWRCAVDRVSFKIAKGQTLCLVGESGSGKTSIALAIARLLQQAQVNGRVLLQGDSIYDLPVQGLRQLRRTRISFIFQNPEAGLLPNRTIGRQLLDVVSFRTAADQEQARRQAGELLARVGLSEKEIWSSYAHQLSGGMCQRVLLVMALCIHPVLVIADEPLSSLDSLTQEKTMALLSDLQETFQFAMLFITHDLRVAAHLADEIGVLKSGQLLELRKTQDFFSRPLSDYSQQLIRSARTLSIAL